MIIGPLCVKYGRKTACQPPAAQNSGHALSGRHTVSLKLALIGIRFHERPITLNIPLFYTWQKDTTL